MEANKTQGDERLAAESAIPPFAVRPSGSMRAIYRTVRRILQLWRMYAALDFTFLLSDFRLALMWYVSDGVVNFASVTATLLLAERFAGIGGWSRDQIMFMLGYAAIVSALMHTFFGYNVLMISRRLGRGQLDHTLAQPQPVWLALLTEGFMPFSGVPMLLPGIGLLAWAMARLPAVAGPGWLALLLLNLAASSAIMLAFAFLWGSLAFWAPRSAEEISSSAFRMLDQLKGFPLDGVGPLLLGGMLGALPVGFVAWYPCRALLGLGASPGDVWITPLAALLFTSIATFVFLKGMRHYERTGSQRYSSLGHRG